MSEWVIAQSCKWSHFSANYSRFYRVIERSASIVDKYLVITSICIFTICSCSIPFTIAEFISLSVAALLTANDDNINFNARIQSASEIAHRRKILARWKSLFMTIENLWIDTFATHLQSISEYAWLIPTSYRWSKPESAERWDVFMERRIDVWFGNRLGNRLREIWMELRSMRMNCAIT